MEKFQTKDKKFSMDLIPDYPFKIKAPRQPVQFFFYLNDVQFVFLQRHINGTDVSFSLDGLFQLLSSQPENSLEVIGTLLFPCRNMCALTCV